MTRKIAFSMLSWLFVSLFVLTSCQQRQRHEIDASVEDLKQELVDAGEAVGEKFIDAGMDELLPDASDIQTLDAGPFSLDAGTL